MADITLKDVNGNKVVLDQNTLLEYMVGQEYRIAGLSAENIIDLRAKYFERGGELPATTESIDRVFDNKKEEAESKETKEELINECFNPDDTLKEEIYYERYGEDILAIVKVINAILSILRPGKVDNNAKPLDMICENCKWFQILYNNSGICRSRHPDSNGFPHISSNEWCGEFEQKDGD